MTSEQRSSPREITLGETRYPIAAFSNRKVLIAGQMLKKVSGAASEISRRVVEFRNAYRERNREIITRQMAAVPPWREVLDFMTAEDWERAGGQIELRRDPSENEVILEAFPFAFEIAEDEVKQLLALVIIPNEELGRAALDGDVPSALERYGDKILDDGTFGQMIDLVDIAADVLREELGARSGAVGRLRALWMGRQTPATDQGPTSSDLPAGDSARNAGLSTDSPAPTDGDTARSSTESRGAPRSVSAS